MYLDANNLYGSEMSQKLPVGSFRWVKDLHSDLTFLPERKEIGKCNKLVYIVQDKEIYVVHIRTLK